MACAILVAARQPEVQCQPALPPDPQPPQSIICRLIDIENNGEKIVILISAPAFWMEVYGGAEQSSKETALYQQRSLT